MNTPDANTISAAEHTIALLLSLSRNVHEGYHAMVHGRWDRHKFIGSELQNKSIGIIGLGKIGTEVIKRLHAFDMKILGYDPYVKKGSYELDYVEIIEEMDELCKESDYISIHIPRTKKTTGLFNIEKFKLMNRSGLKRKALTTSSVTVSIGGGVLSELLSSGGMSGMLDTIWLVISAMIFGGVMESSGFLKKISSVILSKVSSHASIVTSTAGTCIFFNLTASDQYLTIVVPGKMYSKIYKEKGLAPENLSRTLEDSGTVTSVLVPWNTCGAYHASVLNVATVTYLPFCFFSLISPIMTIIFAFLKIRIKKLAS